MFKRLQPWSASFKALGLKGNRTSQWKEWWKTVAQDMVTGSREGGGEGAARKTPFQ